MVDEGKSPQVRGLHVQFGEDAAREAVVSWATETPVTGGRVTVTGPRSSTTVPATTHSYTDARSGRTIHAHHARVTDLHPATYYALSASHDGATAAVGGWRTAPSGRAPVSFTVFGDQGVPMDPDRAEALGLPRWGGGLGAPEAAGTTAAVEALCPLFHIAAGDLAYSNLARDRVETWRRYFDAIGDCARRRPWMPVPGNHENERGNGALGYDAYRTFFSVPPASHHTDTTSGLWYGFTAGSARIIAIHTDDLALQHAGDDHIHGYSDGAQLAWLREELATSRTDPDIDWVVIVGHQLCISTADQANGADLGLRRALIPLCDEFGVDLVIGGHDHHYERSHPVRGFADNATLTPLVPPGAVSEEGVIDATAGTVHVLVGSGGTSAPTHERLTVPPRCRVITGTTETDDPWGRRMPRHEWEDAAWSAARNDGHPFGLVRVEIDPGEPGGPTRLTLSYLDVLDDKGTMRPFETVILERPRGDGSDAVLPRRDISLPAGL